MAKQRVKIPKKTEDEVMSKSQGKCYCGKHGDQIHHIDGNPANNDFDNLILLCFDHHDDASVKNGLKKRFSPSQLKAKRNDTYQLNEKKKDIELKQYTTTLKKITDENLYRSSLDAAIVIELLKIKMEFFNEQDLKKQQEILLKFRIYINHYSSLKIPYEIFDFCRELSHRTRGGLPIDTFESILNLIYSYFPYPKNAKEKLLTSEIVAKCGDTALGIIYDATIHLGNMAITCYGLEILKYLYLRGKELKMKSITNMVLSKYEELGHHLNRPERNDLETAKAFLKLYKDDLESNQLLYPEKMTRQMFNLIEEHRKASKQKTKH